MSGETDPTSTGAGSPGACDILIGRSIPLSITTKIQRVAVFGVAVTLGLTVMAGVASAAPAADRGKGPDQGATLTEDTDTNDRTANNVVDDGDNAHPSGKDRSVEHGGSGNQGKAQHDPDDDGRGPDRSNGGVDQPGGAGGVDLADQDGNNGCGNDDDFEDDNEGWCGKPPAKAPTVEQPRIDVPAVTNEVAPSGVVTAVPADVASEAAAPAAVAPEVLSASLEAPAIVTEVLGVTLERGPAPAPAAGVLARTGVDLTTFVLAALALVLAGVGCTRLGRRTA